jgi:osmoprotectant transport system permease protein
MSERSAIPHGWRRPVLLAGLLAFALLALPHSAPLFHAGFPQLSHPLYTRTGFAALTLAHLGLVATASTIAIGLGLALGIGATRPAGRPLLSTVQAIAVIGQTFPPVAVLAIAVPLLGYGSAPTLLALALYGVLPVLAQTVAGLRNVPAEVREAADGMGFGRWRRLLQVELPLAVAPIMTGVRLSVVVAIGTATIGSTVGARTLGSPIIEGLVGNNTAYVIQGALLVGLLALLVDSLLGWLQQRLQPAHLAAVAAPRHRSQRAGALVCALTILPLIGLLASRPAQAAASPPAWRIESFCHRPVAAERRCLIRARQGILVFTIAELPRAPTSTQWREGIALLAWRSAQGTQWRYYRPPQQLGPAFDNVLAVDPGRHRVAYRQGRTLQVVDMFSAATLTHWSLPEDLRAGSLQLNLDDPQPRVSWRDRANRTQTLTLDAARH